MTAAERRAVSARMKTYWAARREARFSAFIADFSERRNAQVRS